MQSVLPWLKLLWVHPVALSLCGGNTVVELFEVTTKFILGMQFLSGYNFSRTHKLSPITKTYTTHTQCICGKVRSLREFQTNQTYAKPILLGLRFKYPEVRSWRHSVQLSAWRQDTMIIYWKILSLYAVNMSQSTHTYTMASFAFQRKPVPHNSCMPQQGFISPPLVRCFSSLKSIWEYPKFLPKTTRTMSFAKYFAHTLAESSSATVRVKQHFCCTLLELLLRLDRSWSWSWHHASLKAKNDEWRNHVEGYTWHVKKYVGVQQFLRQRALKSYASRGGIGD